MNKQIRILLDLDGVMCDFAEQYKRINGKAPIDVYQPGSTPGPEKDLLWNRYVDQAGFEDAPLHAGALELICVISNLVRDGRVQLVEICTSAGGRARMEDVTRQKKVWLKLHGLEDLTAHIVQNGYKKAEVINTEKYHDILIDDTDRIVDNFRSRGGFAVLHTSISDTIEQLNSILDSINELSGN